MVATSMAETELFSIANASITDIQHLYASGSLTTVDLVAKLLHRISTFDCRGPRLNSIPIINPDVFAEAAASDARRANGKTLGLLDGIPYTVKDSHKVEGMAMANGSVAFQNVIASDDAFTVQKLREAGAVLVGRTNMPSMATDKMQPGVYGKSRSSSNIDQRITTLGSKLMDGSAVAVAANFALFGMGSDNRCSRWSLRSKGAVVTYTPSRGAVSTRGIWPMLPAGDVVVPHTRAVEDLLILLETIAMKDPKQESNFLTKQSFRKVQNPWQMNSGRILDVEVRASLRDMRVAIPRADIDEDHLSNCAKVNIDPDLTELYRRIKSDFEKLGATVITVPFSSWNRFFENLEGRLAGSFISLQHQHGMKRSALTIRAWEKFLHENDDPNINSLADVNWSDIVADPCADGSQAPPFEVKERYLFENLVSSVDKPGSVQEMLRTMEAAETSEHMNQTCLEDWLDMHECDFLVFPAAISTCGADGDDDRRLAENKLQHIFQHGNDQYTLRRCGAPIVTIPMATSHQDNTPVSMVLAGQDGDDSKLIRWAAAYDNSCRRREQLKTPQTRHDLVHSSRVVDEVVPPPGSGHNDVPDLVVEKCVSFSRWQKDLLHVQIEGYVTIKERNTSSGLLQPIIEVFIDAVKVEENKVIVRRLSGSMAGRVVFDFSCLVSTTRPPKLYDEEQAFSEVKIARDSTMIVILARTASGERPVGHLELL